MNSRPRGERSILQYTRTHLWTRYISETTITSLLSMCLELYDIDCGIFTLKVFIMIIVVKRSL